MHSLGFADFILVGFYQQLTFIQHLLSPQHCSGGLEVINHLLLSSALSDIIFYSSVVNEVTEI